MSRSHDRTCGADENRATRMSCSAVSPVTRPAPTRDDTFFTNPKTLVSLHNYVTVTFVVGLAPRAMMLLVSMFHVHGLIAIIQ
jgi:hypothetical protein